MYSHGHKFPGAARSCALLILLLIAPGAFAQHVGLSGRVSPGTVNLPPDVSANCMFMVAASADSVMLPRGGSVTVTVNLSCLPPGGSVALSLLGVPADVVGSFGANLTPTSVPLTLSAGNTAPLGTFVLTIMATSGGLTASTSIVVTITDGGGGTCHIGYDIVSAWDDMFEAVLSIDNTGTMPVSPGWTLTWSFANGQTVSQLWNGTVMQTGANVSVQGDANIPVGGSDKGVGFLGMTIPNAPNQVPITFSLNGVLCAVN